MQIQNDAPRTSDGKPAGPQGNRASPAVVVVGAGPAGLTAAYELARAGVRARILEANPERVGGLSRTVCHRGNRFDIGGHRFFTKSPEIQALWEEILGEDLLTVQRLSRILYRGKFFDYPLKAGNALRNLGLVEAACCFASYARARLFPCRPERSFRDWMVNRFGQRLFSIFFKTYTEKVWGMPCEEISADWAAQRIQDLNLWKAALKAVGLGPDQRVVKSLVDCFGYPRLGPGMLWERMAERLVAMGSRLQLGWPVEQVEVLADGLRFHSRGRAVKAEHAIVSMPLRHLVERLSPAPAEAVLCAARALRYRDFMTVVLTVDVPQVFPDNWIYVHDARVRVGRIQNYKNWSQEMVARAGQTVLGLEYFCFEGDKLWSAPDADVIGLAIDELSELALVDPSAVVDATLLRIPRAYPVYDDGYKRRIDVIRNYLASHVPGIQMVGRNGMHRYNNQDHAMMTGILAARNLCGACFDPWRVNGDAVYLEGEVTVPADARAVPRRLLAAS